ncbi:ABC transporter permease [Companilactobacillus pabuli]|jgi:Predicted ABC-type exoprotein transport system, permease component|uniref:ABC transporter permease n=1 Tax=Companilactobacillus pabuli TaxID=2714036 RepID=A0A7L7KYL3_9LACO|nr:ABC transporter permease [Companilactobacillus pabuli]AKP03611.1 ABC transporter [Companilactobacillus farciminis]AKS51916.1 ABC transporter [Companilactobacillus farciminis]MDG5112818.1 ABC transporter permease [Companilactobacillus pabuli]QMT84406.1 ABC transporter permease [Companilactobacillus pabuli]GAQ00461.1 ABC transporter [Companilactobacillus farciminis]
MLKLWNERLRRHQLNQFKYLRLIFNDNFVLAFIVLIGALGFWYSNLLGTISGPIILGKPIVIVLLFLAVQVGGIATLLEDPDSTFLLVKEKEFYKYFKAAKNYSVFVPIVTLVLVNFLLSAFASRAGGMKVLDIVVVAIGLIIYKLGFLNVNLMELYGQAKFGNTSMRLVSNLLLLVSLIISTYFFSWLMIIVGVVFYLYLNARTKTLETSGQLQWKYAIETENQRMFRIKRFYNLFTDVPGVNSKIKRRKWLDGLYKSIKPISSNTYLYLFARGFVRNNEYIGLFLRLTIIQAIMLALIDNFYISLVVEMLFIYLVGFQLKPYFKEVMQNLMQRLYPISGKTKINDFTKLSTFILLIQWIISALAVLYKFGFSINSLIIIVAGLAVLFFVNYFYMPRQLKKYLD